MEQRYQKIYDNIMVHLTPEEIAGMRSVKRQLINGYLNIGET